MTPDDMEAVVARLEEDAKRLGGNSLCSVVRKADLRALLLDYQERGRALEAASPVVPVGVGKDQEATVVNALIAFANAVEGQSRSRRMALACQHTKALVAALGTKGADHD
jgi:hypothetical protein